MVDLWHTTTGLSADQSIQFARAIDLDVTLVSYGLLEDLLLCALSVDLLGVDG